MHADCCIDILTLENLLYNVGLSLHQVRPISIMDFVSLTKADLLLLLGEIHLLCLSELGLGFCPNVKFVT